MRKRLEWAEEQKLNKELPGAPIDLPLELPKEELKELVEKSRKMPVYLFFSNQKEFELQIKNWPLQKLMGIQKGKGSAYSILYKVITQ